MRRSKNRGYRGLDASEFIRDRVQPKLFKNGEYASYNIDNVVNTTDLMGDGKGAWVCEGKVGDAGISMIITPNGNILAWCGDGMAWQYPDDTINIGDDEYKLTHSSYPVVKWGDEYFNLTEVGQDAYIYTLRNIVTRVSKNNTYVEFESSRWNMRYDIATQTTRDTGADTGADTQTQWWDDIFLQPAPKPYVTQTTDSVDGTITIKLLEEWDQNTTVIHQKVILAPQP